METKKVLSIQEVISTNENLLKSLRADAQELIQASKVKSHRRFILPLSYSDFLNVFRDFGKLCLMSRSCKDDFVVDKYNEPVIQQIYLYAINHSAFCGDLNKGMLLQGKFGCGKTILLETYSMLHNHVVQKHFQGFPMYSFIKSVALQELIIKQSLSNFTKRPLIIDEFGRESKVVQNFGNVSRPISELLSLRSDIGSATHGTTNFSQETLSSNDFYGGMIGDRLRVMFNFITLEGDSRRK